MNPQENIEDSSGKKKRKRLLIGCGIGCIAICLILGVIAVLSYWRWGTDIPQNINASIECPSTVTLGDDFNLIVQITNSANDVQKLGYIIFDPTYLDGFVVRNVDPEPSSVIESLDSFYFYLDIPANETLIVEFNMVATEVGEYDGLTHVCIDPYTNCLKTPIRTIVEKEKENEK